MKEVEIDQKYCLWLRWLFLCSNFGYGYMNLQSDRSVQKIQPKEKQNNGPVLSPSSLDREVMGPVAMILVF